MEKLVYKGLGRRKSSVARVRLTPGTGKFKINKRNAQDYLMSDLLLQNAEQPLEITKTKGTFDISSNVKGGGLSGQAGAIRLGITRALLKVSDDYRNPLKESKMTTRDARAKERKKPGLRKARRARQFSKR